MRVLFTQLFLLHFWDRKWKKRGKEIHMKIWIWEQISSMPLPSPLNRRLISILDPFLWWKTQKHRNAFFMVRSFCGCFHSLLDRWWCYSRRVLMCVFCVCPIVIVSVCMRRCHINVANFNSKTNREMFIARTKIRPIFFSSFSSRLVYIDKNNIMDWSPNTTFLLATLMI